MSYDNWKQQTPPENHSEDEEEKCQDCDNACHDMRYTFENHDMQPICPICQQERKVNDLQIQLSQAVKELETIKLEAKNGI